MNRAELLFYFLCVILTGEMAPNAAFAASTVARIQCGNLKSYQSVAPGKSLSQESVAQALIYRDQPLTAVIADLNSLGPHIVDVGPRAAQVHFSGVLVVKDQEGMIIKLTQLLPIFLHCEGEGLMLRTTP